MGIVNIIPSLSRDLFEQVVGLEEKLIKNMRPFDKLRMTEK